MSRCTFLGLVNAPQVQLEDRYGLEPGKMFSEVSAFRLQSGEANEEMSKELKTNTSQLSRIFVRSTFG